jgi:ParB/RepB/Spo0J family partition protein
MAKKSSQPPTAVPATVAEPPPPPDIQQVLLRDIDPSLYQPRRFPVPDGENPKLLDLARSIRAKSVIQPILVRPVEPGRFELVFGECRVRASKLDLPELDAIGPRPLYIPAIVRNLSDTEAAELTVEENIRRQDLSPLEEAAGVHTLLLLHKGDALAVAARLGQTPGWVACRARIHSNLSARWKELLSDPESPFHSWTAAHVEEIAKLAAEVQDEILEDYSFDHVDNNITVPELRRLIEDLTRKLGRAPFPLDDETLLPTAGACTNCPLTTLASPFLFAEDDGGVPADIKDARCLNRTCWKEKCHRSTERAAAKHRDEHPDLLIVAARDMAPEEIPPAWRGGVLPTHAYDKVKKGAEGAQPAMLAGGSQTGKLIWIRPAVPLCPSRQPQPEIPAEDQTSPDANPAPVRDLLAERRAKHMNRRIARMAERARELLEACDGKSLSPQILVALAHVFGTNQSRKGAWQYHSTNNPWAELETFSGLTDEEAATEIWTIQLQPVIASRLQYCGPTDAPRLHREVVAALKLIGASYPDLYRSVAKELPEPKAWISLPGYQPEDLEADPPAPVAAVLPLQVDDRYLDGEDADDLERIPA